MKYFKKENIHPLLSIISIIAGIFAYWKYEHFELMILLIFIPFFILMILTYIDFEKITRGNDYIMLSKKSIADWKWIFLILIIMVCLKNLTVYSGILIAVIIVHTFLWYTVSKRRVFVINESGVREVNIQEKKRELSEITRFDIYGNNVEMKFNEKEILQINKNELLYPKWDTFVSQMNALDVYVNDTKNK